MSHRNVDREDGGACGDACGCSDTCTAEEGLGHGQGLDGAATAASVQLQSANSTGGLGREQTGRPAANSADIGVRASRERGELAGERRAGLPGWLGCSEAQVHSVTHLTCVVTHVCKDIEDALPDEGAQRLPKASVVPKR
jgi:hypothetical protein